MVNTRLLSSLRKSIEVAAKSGYDSDAEIRSLVSQWVRDEVRQELRDEQSDVRERMAAELLDELEQALAEQRARESTWNELTTNDRIDAAFVALRSEGIVAIQNAGFSMADGWYRVEKLEPDIPGAWGGLFFHGQDVERAVEDSGLLLSFGAFEAGEAHEAESLRLARRVCEVLERHGLETDWNGTLKQRISILPFPWKKRRYTTPPRQKVFGSRN